MPEFDSQAAGISRGIQAGVGLYQGIVGGAQDRELKQREANRMDEQHQVLMNQARTQAIQSVLQSNAEQAAAAAANGQDYSGFLEHSKLLQQQLQESQLRLVGPQVLAGYKQAQQDANALANKDVTMQDLGPDRSYNVTALAYPNPTHLIDDYDHPEGTTTFAQHRDNMHAAAQAGDWNGVMHHSAQILGHAASPYEPDHEAHQPGLNTNFGQDQEDTPHNRAMHGMGLLEAAHAGINSDHPEAEQIRGLLGQAAKGGAQDRVDMARKVFFLAGGPGGLERFLQSESEDQKKFKFLHGQLFNGYKSQGLSDADADKKATQETLDRLYRDPAALEEMKFKNEQTLQREKIASESGLRSAQADEARARGEYYRQGGHKTGLTATLSAIEDQLDDPDLAPERRQFLQQQYDAAIANYGTNRRQDRGAVTDADLHKQASSEAQQVVRAAAQAGKPVPDIAAETNRIYGVLKENRDRAKPQAAAAPGGRPAAAPKTGDIQDGYIFMGGDPADRKNWTKQDGG
jgi:hypothetical protein